MSMYCGFLRECTGMKDRIILWFYYKLLIVSYVQKKLIESVISDLLPDFRGQGSINSSQLSVVELFLKEYHVF